MKIQASFNIMIPLLVILAFSAAPSTAGDRISAEKAFVEAQKSLADGDDQTAEKALMTSLRLDPAFTSAIWQLSQIYERRGKLEYARELLLRGLQQEPGASWARDKLGQLEKTLTRKLLSEAQTHMAAGRYDQAVPKLSLYLGIKPHDPAPLEMLGRCHLALDNLKMAGEYLRQAIERDPSNRDIASLIDEVEKRISRSEAEEAIGRAETILADYEPGKSPGARKEAEDALREILDMDPGNEWAAGKLKELAMPAPVKAGSVEEEVPGGATEDESPETKAEGRGFPRALLVLTGGIAILFLASASVLLALNLRGRTRVKSHPLQGSLSLIPMLDIVSLLSSNLKTGRLAVTAEQNRGEIYFEKGEIIHARFRNYDGKSAFHRILELQNGDYFFFNHLPKVKHTISEPLSLLLLSIPREEQPKPAKKSGSTTQKIGV